MDNKIFQNKMNEIQEKIGEDSSALILDDIGLLLTDNEEMNNQLINKDKEIETLKKTNETLQKVNGNLLQQVSMAEDDSVKPPAEESKKISEFDFKSVFDKDGNFKNVIDN